MDFKIIPISKDALEWQCSILKLAGLTVLLDCGWSESLDVSLLNPLLPHLKDLDLVVLSHANFKHTGAVPYLLTKYRINCPIISTEPVSRLGELSCVACLEDREKYKPAADGFDVDDVLRTFMSRVTPLKYRETFHVQARGRTLAACPYPAGHHLGSAYWTLHCGPLCALYIAEGDLRQSRFLDGLDLHRLLPSSRGASQPWDVLIMAPLATMGAALPMLGVQQKPQEAAVPTKALTVARNVREQLLLEGTIATLRRGGSVLIPTDVVGSVPEVLLLLDAAWEQDRQLSTNYPLVWLSSMGDMVLDQIKTRLEWMSKEVLLNFETRLGTNPFVLRNVRIFQTLDELCAAHPLSRPKVMMCTSQYLEGGDSRELFLNLCSEQRSLLWLMGVPVKDTLARQLFDDFILQHASRKEYRLQQHSKVSLPEEELKAYYDSKVAEFVHPKMETTADAPAETTAVPAGEVPTKETTVEPEAAATPTALWSPPGWPGSPTLPHVEIRGEGDGYGHFLTATELKSWRSQDQGSDRYGMSAGDVGDDAEGQQGSAEHAKIEEEAALEKADPLADWRESLRIHFPEPMQTEVHERTVRVSCRIRYLPDTTMEPKDLYMLLRTVGPKHAVLLPTADDFTSGEVITKQFQHSNLNGATAPQIHALRPTDPPLELSLRTPKRRVQFKEDMWKKVSFFKAHDGVRLARVRARVNSELDRGILELGLCPPAGQGPGAADSNGRSKGDTDKDEAKAASAAAEGSTLAKSEEDRLPRGGALFVATGEEPITLSSLKEQLRRSEWTRDVPVEFKHPSARTGRPWSARILDVGNKVSLGWASVPPPAGSAAAAGTGAAAPAREPQALRLEGVPGEEFYAARAALYKRCAIV